ncbi:MAG: ATP-dependent transcriptional regulator, MalT-like, LuxR family [Marmoricola sp.]|nr:ATP-dependent transcriptional regulator, MalT-like, LuxR family [Marmoricola sp.]
MPAPLLETKLYLPGPREGLVPRPRLSQRFERVSAAKLMLVSAPAGFGKTTMLAQWLASGPVTPADGPSAAWLSLDRGDNDPATFWTYVIAALRRVVPGVGDSALALLASPHPPPIQLVLTTLLNELGAGGSEVVLVLDDYHLIDSREVQDAMTFLLEHLPPQLHLVIASRADPAVPLARMRARGELVEIRAAELRFTPEEAAAYLNGVMGLQLTADDVAALEERTEGWIAALQLAALSMQGREDVAGLIAGFTGDDRYIVDYLAEEVLQRQPGDVRDFLLRTSLLSRLSGPLCDAVTGTGGGKAMLEALDRGNLFLVPLDDRRHWYRYQHLFADVLRARLAEESSPPADVLHRRASDWFAENGERSEAIRHAIAGHHFGRAAELVELATPALLRDRQEAMLRGWIEQLPEELLQVRPVLSNGYVGALLSTGSVEGVERHLQDAERWVDAPGRPDEGTEVPRTQMVVADDAEFHRLPAGIAVHRAGLALMLGDPATTVTQAQRALDLLAEDDDVGRGAAAALIGLASWASGDLEAAHEAYSECVVRMRGAGHLSDVLGCSITLADLRITQGSLRDAMRTYEQALQLNPEHGGPVLRGTADMYVGMSALHRERNDLATARELLARCEELGEHNGLPQNRYRWRVAMARLRAAEGDLGQAVVLLDEAERAYVGDFSPNVRPVPAVRARAWIAQGQTEDALGWARDQGLSIEDDLSYLREYEHLTLARALLARHGTDPEERTLDQATALLERLRRAAEAGRRAGSVIEILVLQALARRMHGDIPAALEPLERALALAEPEGYVRTFVDEGPPMAALLEATAERGIAHRYARRLLTAFGGVEDRRPRQQGLVEPLSQREHDVLRLLRSDLGGPEIARELVVSLNTVRTHTRNIYAKLGVNNRRAAVRRAEELDLITRTRDRSRVVHDE